MTVGIYCLRFIGTDKVYIGQSNNIKIRFYQHKYKLENGTGTVKLQEAYHLYGTPMLHILLICTENMLDTYENLIIKHYNSVNNGFNSYDESRGRRGHKGLQGDENPTSKYSNELIASAFLHIVDNPKDTLEKVSKIFNISISTLGAVTSLSQHKWLEDQYPSEYNELRNRKGLNQKGYKYCAEALGIIYPQIINPDGKVFEVSNLSKFARDNGLMKSNLCSLLKGHRKSHKGWRLLPCQ